MSVINYDLDVTNLTGTISIVVNYKSFFHLPIKAQQELLNRQEKRNMSKIIKKSLYKGDGLPFRSDEIFTRKVLELIENRQYEIIFAYLDTFKIIYLDFNYFQTMKMDDFCQVFPFGYLEESKLDKLEIPYSEVSCVKSWACGNAFNLIKIYIESTDQKIIDLALFLISKIKDRIKTDIFGSIIRKIIKQPEYKNFKSKMKHNYKLSDTEEKFVKKINALLPHLNPYLNNLINTNFNLPIRKTRDNCRLAFIGYEPWITVEESYDDGRKSTLLMDTLGFFRSIFVNFGPIPIYTKETYLRFPKRCQEQIFTILCCCKRLKRELPGFKDVAINHIFSYLVFNSFTFEKERIQRRFEKIVKLSKTSFNCEGNLKEQCLDRFINPFNDNDSRVRSVKCATFITYSSDGLFTPDREKTLKELAYHLAIAKSFRPILDKIIKEQAALKIECDFFIAATIYIQRYLKENKNLGSIFHKPQNKKQKTVK